MFRPAALILAAALTLVGCTDGAAGPQVTPTPAASEGSTAAPDPAVAIAAAVRPGTYPTTSATYRLDDLQIDGVPRPVEVQGHVVGPVGAPGRLPLVLFLHGYNGSCWRESDGDSSGDWPCAEGFEPIPHWQGFAYLQQRLASQGYLTVSLSGNGVNVLAGGWDEGGGSAARSALVRHHLDAWAEGGIPGTEEWPAVDAGSVLLVGHSRGGEGVDRAVADRPASAGWTVLGEVLIAPSGIDPVEQGTVPVVALTGYCDGDVGIAPGQMHVDRPTDPEVLRSSIIVDGANHNYFNTEWVPETSTVGGGADDAFNEAGEADPLCAPGAATRLSAAEQQEIAARVLGLAAAAFLRGVTPAADVLDGRLPLPVPDDEQVWVSAVGRGRTTLANDDGFSGQGTGGLTVEPCDGVSETEDPGDCGAFTGEGGSPHWPATYRDPEVRQYLELTWAETGGAARLELDEPLDLGTAAGIEARVAVAAGGPPVRFDVVLTDAAGATVTLPAAEELSALPEGTLMPTRRWGQRMFVPLDGAAGIDLTRVTGVALVPGSAPGRAWIIDVSALPRVGP